MRPLLPGPGQRHPVGSLLWPIVTSSPDESLCVSTSGSLSGHLTTSSPRHDRDWLFLARQGLRWGPQLGCLGHLGPISSRSLAFRQVSQTLSHVYVGGGPRCRASQRLGLELTRGHFCRTLFVKANREPVSAVKKKQEGTASSSWWHFGDLPGQFHWGPRDCRPPKACRGAVCSCRVYLSSRRAPRERPLSTQRGAPVGKWQAPNTLHKGHRRAQCTSGPATPLALH